MRIKSKKIKGFDSILEHDHFLLFKNLEKKGLIRKLKKLEKGIDSIELMKSFKISSSATKNSKATIQAIKYTPDFYFEVIKFKELKRDQKVFVEVKSKATKKMRDYSLRRRMFLKYCLENNLVFIEIIDQKFAVFNGEEI